MPHFIYVSDQIQKRVFLSLMKKSIMGHIGYDKIFCPTPLLCVMPHGQLFLGSRKNSALIKVFPPLPKKMESASDENNPGHDLIFLAYKCRK